MGLSIIRKDEKTRDIKTFMPTDNESYVYISYKSVNWEIVLDCIVRKLVDTYGLRVCFDKDFIMNTDSWVENIRHVIEDDKCKAVLCFVSEEYMKSYGCLMDLMIARSSRAERKHHDKKLDIIPIVINSTCINEIKSVSSTKVNIIKDKDFKDVFKSYICSKNAVDYVIEVLKNQDITEKEISYSIQNILKGSFKRVYDESDLFYRNLCDTINYISPEVFELKTFQR